VYFLSHRSSISSRFEIGRRYVSIQDYSFWVLTGVFNCLSSHFKSIVYYFERVFPLFLRGEKTSPFKILLSETRVSTADRASLASSLVSPGNEWGSLEWVSLDVQHRWQYSGAEKVWKVTVTRFGCRVLSVARHCAARRTSPTHLRRFPFQYISRMFRLIIMTCSCGAATSDACAGGIRYSASTKGIFSLKMRNATWTNAERDSRQNVVRGPRGESLPQLNTGGEYRCRG